MYSIERQKDNKEPDIKVLIALYKDEFTENECLPVIHKIWLREDTESVVYAT